eukprot:gene13769-13890_t
MEHYTGSFDFDFVGERFVNAYHNISNIILHISRRDSEHQPAVLLVAHHDSPVGSPGAGDDASNVGVMLELASNLVAGGSAAFPASPVMFLFSGAEEPLCQSAAAFMKNSSWKSRVGVFINLESIGPGGVPVVFQHAGAWVIEAFARSAPHPRGAIAAQDIFDAGLVLGDTDYRQLSYKHRGEFPGIDMAYLLSGAAYHTDRDLISAIRPGVLQETGNTLTAAISSLAKALADACQQGDAALQRLLKPSADKQMFLSVAGKALDAGQGLKLIFSNAGLALLTLISVLLVPAVQGAGRAIMSGTAMVWFAHPAVAGFSYFPISIAVLLVPWGGWDSFSSRKDRQLLPYHVLGGAFLNATVAAILTRFDIGMAMIFALWGFTLVLAAFCVAQGLGLPGLLGALLCVALPMYSCCETVVLLCIVMMSRMSLTGHIFIGLGDAIIGLLLGLGTVSLTGCGMLPVLQATLSTAGIGKYSRKLAAGLFVMGLSVSAIASTGLLFPYSKDMPKRLMLGHLHYTTLGERAQEPTANSKNSLDVGSGSMRVVNSSWVVAGSDSNSAAWLATAMGFKTAEALLPNGNEWGMIYPVSKLLDLQLFPAQPADAGAVVEELPYVKLLSKQAIQQQPATLKDSGGSSQAPRSELVEAQLQIFSAAPCWGTLKLSGVPIESWSITPGLWNDARTFTGGQQGGSGRALLTRQGSPGVMKGDGKGRGDGTVRSLVVKWTNELQQQPLQWPLIVRYHAADNSSIGQQQQQSQDLAGTSIKKRRSVPGLKVEVHVGYVERSAAIAAMLERMPDWGTVSFEATAYVSSWEF